jgi:AcrR family transcriptional regulator
MYRGVMWLNESMRSVQPRAKLAKDPHPTKELLVGICVDMLDHRQPEELMLSEVIEAAGVTKGALYHHFADFSELVESALIVRFGRYVDENVEVLTNLVESCQSRDEVIRALAVMTAETQSPDRRSVRLARAHLLAIAGTNPRLAGKLAAEQSRLTQALADLMAAAQSRGWFNNNFDPKAGAVLVQAYTLGRIVDDVSDDPVDPAEWERLINRVVELVLF